MNSADRARLILGSLLLAAGYFYLLIFLIGWTSSRIWPGWWFSVFPNRHIAAVTWVAALHTVGVLLAALPIALASLLIDRKRARWLGVGAGVAATALAVLPSLALSIWPLIWNSHPVFFVTDQIKLLAAIPVLIWIIECVSSRYRLERTRRSIA